MLVKRRFSQIMYKRNMNLFYFLIIFLFGIRILDSIYYSNGSVLTSVFDSLVVTLDIIVLILLVFQMQATQEELKITKNELERKYKAKFSFKYEFKELIEVNIYNIGLSSAFDVEILCEINKQPLEILYPIMANNLCASIKKQIIKSEESISFKINAPKSHDKIIIIVKYSDFSNDNNISEFIMNDN